MDVLAMARERQRTAKADAAAKNAELESARKALANASVPEGSKLADLPEYKALKVADEAYKTAATEADAADAEVAEAAALLEPKAKIATFGAPAVIDRDKFGPDEAFGFKNLGELVSTIAFNPREVENRGLQYRDEVSTSGAGAEGGFPLPEIFVNQMLQLPTSRSIVRTNHPTVITDGGESPDAAVTLRALNQAGAGNLFGGVAVAWEDEELDADATETTPKTAEVTVQAKSVRAVITETNKFLRNAAWASPILESRLGSVLTNTEDYAFLSGDGTGKPTGVRSCAGMIYVHRQTAGTVVYEDVLNMVAALHPDCKSTAVFVATQGLYPALRDIKDKAGNRVYWTGDPSKGQADTIDGIPVLYTGKVGAKGAKGDLILCDFTYYLIKEGQAPLISTSSHVKFLRDRTVIKINRSVDGKGWLTGPLVLEDGVTEVSPFVGLDLVSA